MFDYQRAAPPRNYPLLFRSDDWNFDLAVRGVCDACTASASGGSFNRSTRVTLASPDNAAIAYAAVVEGVGSGGGARRMPPLVPYTGPFDVHDTTDVIAYTVAPNGSTRGLPSVLRYVLSRPPSPLLLARPV